MAPLRGAREDPGLGLGFIPWLVLLIDSLWLLLLQTSQPLPNNTRMIKANIYIFNLRSVL